jgi:tetratricopeptide (TPR) repeat protein
LKAELARLQELNRQGVEALEVTRRREAALKKALGVEAKKVFEAGRVAREIKDAQQEEQRLKAEAAAKREPVVKETVWPINAEDQTVAGLLNSARRHLAAKQAREAEADYLQALKLEPNNPRVSYNLGVLYGDYLKEPRKAARYYKQYLKLAPRAPDAPVVKAWISQLEADW